MSETLKVVKMFTDPSTQEGTFGKLITPTGKIYFTGELAWHENKKGNSCIPAGTYTCEWIQSPKRGWCYLVKDVPGRDMIEIHSANFMGDPPLVRQLEGCIALGLGLDRIPTTPNAGAPKQLAVTQSKAAVKAFDTEMDKKPFTLIITRTPNLQH